MPRSNACARRRSEQGLPITPHKLTPEIEDSFWVNLIGKGYPAPRQKFRWCTERLKIHPSNKFIREVVAQNGEAILVLGTRKAESQRRAATMAKHEARRVRDRLSPNASLPNSLVYTPIEDWSNDDVWLYLMQVKNPWGHDNKSLAGHVPGSLRGRRMPARRRHHHAQLRHQPLRLLGLHGRGQGPVDGGDDQERRGEGLDDPAPGAPQRAGQARRPRPPRLPPHERPGPAVPRPHRPRPYTKEWREHWLRRVLEAQQTPGKKGRRSSAPSNSSPSTNCTRSAGSGSTRSTSSTTSCRASTRRSTARAFPSAGTRPTGCGQTTGSSCGEVCGDDQAFFDLQVSLLGVERQFRGMSRRAGIYEALEDRLRTGLYGSEQEAVAVLSERLRKRRRTGEQEICSPEELPIVEAPSDLRKEQV